MQIDDLVRMIDQIAEFFAAYPDDEAIAGIVDHLKRFWEPDMRAQMIDARAACADRLHPLARRALDALAKESTGR